MFVLKRLSDAIVEGDRIHAIIKASEVNQCGSSSSITRPHSPTQAKLIRRLLSSRNIPASSVDVVEAHGTGTQVSLPKLFMQAKNFMILTEKAGDCAEISTLLDVFSANRSPKNSLIVSSIKGNIGHCEAASGAAGLAKLILMMRHEMIAPQAALSEINPQFSEQLTGKILIPRASQRWKRSGGRRRAVLNNFGAAGSNCAILIEEPPPKRNSNTRPVRRSAYPFVVSAKTDQGLEELKRSYLGFIQRTTSSTSIVDLSYSSCARRQIYAYRSDFSCSSKEDLCTQLRSSSTGNDTDAVDGRRPISDVIFVFSGQGSLYFGMGGRNLLYSSPLMLQVIEQCERHLVELGVETLRPYLEGASTDNDITSVEHIVGSQCACVALEYALARLLMAWNILPSLVLGHSLGEYTAMAIAGMITIEEALTIVARRAFLMKDLCEIGQSGMLTCHTSVEVAERLILERMPERDLQVACKNSPNSSVVAGDVQCLQDFQEICKDAGVKAKALNVPLGFHSLFIDPIAVPLREECKGIILQTPRIPILSNRSGTLFDDAASSEYFSQHATNAVDFISMMDHVRSKSGLCSPYFIDIGPHPTTLPLVQANLPPDYGLQCSATLHKSQDSWTCLNKLLLNMAPHYHRLDWRAVFRETQASFVPLPGHPTEPMQHYVPYQEDGDDDMSDQIDQTPSIKSHATGFTLLPMQDDAVSTDRKRSFSTTTDVLREYIEGHKVSEVAICPASVYFELFLEAAHIAFRPRGSADVNLSDLSFANPLMLRSDGASTSWIEISLEAAAEEPHASIHAFSTGEDGCRTHHCSAQLSFQVKAMSSWQKISAAIGKEKVHLMDSRRAPDILEFTRPIIYQMVFPRVVDYSQDYHTIERLLISLETLQGIGTFEVSQPQDKSLITLPAFTDTLLHTAGFVANIVVGKEEICICAEVASLKVLTHDVKAGRYTVYCSLYNPERNVFEADSFALNSAGQIVACVQGMMFKRLNQAAFRRRLESTSNATNSMSHAATNRSSSHRKILGNAAASVASTSEGKGSLEKRIIGVICSICAIEEGNVNRSTKLESFGVDSLMLFELKDALRQNITSANLTYLDLESTQTIQDIADAIQTQQKQSTPVSTLSANSMVDNAISSALPSAQADSSTTPDDSVHDSEMANRQNIIETISKACGVDISDVAAETKLDALGMDSLLLIELADSLHKRCGFEPNSLNLTSELTIRDVADRCKHLTSAATLDTNEKDTHRPVRAMDIGPASLARCESSESFLRPLQERSDSSDSSLLIIHDGSGLATRYASLGNLDRNVAGGSSPYLQTPRLIAPSVREMAVDYLKKMKSSDWYAQAAMSGGAIIAGT